MILSRRIRGAMCVAIIACAAWPALGDSGDSKTAILIKATSSGKPLARRRAARKLLAMGKPAKAAILELAKSDDVVIKRVALRRALDVAGADAVPVLTTAMHDPDPLVRIVAVEELCTFTPRTKEVGTS